ncbi:hypothetical protein ACFWVB_25435 [Streptomyces microflavus]|uniref:hypothetical protein n=1 Tax=Streptomyces microflavus TaxID=1919 RepID=UPI003659FF4E
MDVNNCNAAGIGPNHPDRQEPLPDYWTRFWEHLAVLFEGKGPEGVNGPQKAA